MVYHVMRAIDAVLGILMREERARAHATRPFALVRPDASLRVLFVGDSLVVGVGASHPSATVAGRFAADFPQAHIENLGRCGARVDYVRSTLQRLQAAGERFDLIVIQIGGNDITHLTALSELAADLSASLEAARAMAPKVVVMSYGDVGRSPRFFWPVTRLYSERSYEARKVFKDVARRQRVSFIDLLHPKYDPTLHPEKYIADDGLHVNDAGYALFYRALLRVLKRQGLVSRVATRPAMGGFVWEK